MNYPDTPWGKSAMNRVPILLFSRGTTILSLQEDANSLVFPISQNAWSKLA